MNPLAISIAIVLLPGLIATVICDKITVHNPKWDYFKYAIYSYLFGVVSYLFLQIGFWLRDILIHLFSCNNELLLTSLNTWSIVTTNKTTASLNEIFLAILMSPFVAFLAAAIVNHKVVTNFASKLKVSQKYGDENLFSFFLGSPGIDWVYVREPDKGLTYLGRVASYSENDTLQELVLTDVEVFQYNTAQLIYKLEAIYLSNKTSSFIIELPNKSMES